MLILFNNCRGRDHKGMYGSDAFYDLNVVGFQATKATDLEIGQQCVVAKETADGIVFDWYSFLREEVRPDDTRIPCRVLFGSFIKSEIYSKAVAAQTEPYSGFFDVNGNFKRHSVIESTDSSHLRAVPKERTVRVVRRVGRRSDPQVVPSTTGPLSPNELGELRRELIRILNRLEPDRGSNKERGLQNGLEDFSEQV